jgi:hypothetical protein
MRWFLPAAPDVLKLLRRQVAITIAGMDAFAAWAGGDAAAAATVREREHAADAIKRELHRTLREAFITPLEPEDVFALSRSVDRIINQAKDLVREAEVMACPPDAALAEMAAELADSTRRLDAAIAELSGDATPEADAAIKGVRRLERVYRAAMGELLRDEDLREVTARRELYRRASRIGDAVEDVAERILYAAVKEA